MSKSLLPSRKTPAGCHIASPTYYLIKVSALIMLLSVCLTLVSFIAPGMHVNAQSGGDFKLSVSSANHTAYGLSYPVTYVFSIPSDATSLKAHKRYDLASSWSQLIEKTTSDFFNGIECVRFDYTADKAYVSVAFSNSTDDIYFNITDASGDTINFTFDGIATYYDNRKAVVTATADDWQDDRNNDFISACNQFQSRSIWFTSGLITGNIGTSTWTRIQAEINDGYIEVAAHSRTHTTIPYADYASEIEGCKQDITGNLTLPAIYTNGSSEYVYAWLEPYGQSDASARTQLGVSHYLVDRDINVNKDVFATWDATNNLYNTIGYSIRMGTDGSANTTTLNNKFDTVYSAGGIYHLMCHPYNVNWGNGQYAQQHLDYIKGKKDVWYVGFGALYLYHYTRKLIAVSVV